MRLPRRLAFSLTLCLGWAAPRGGEGVAHAYRPFDGTDADVAEAGELELELGALGYRTLRGSHLYAPNGVINYGFAPRFELVLQARALVPFAGTPDPAGARVDDGQINVKAVVHEGSLQGKVGPSVAAEGGLWLPATGSGENRLGGGVAVIFSQRWPAIALHLNAGAAFTPSQQWDVTLGLIAEGPATWRVRPVAEVFVEQATDEATTGSALLGAIARVTDSVSLDVAVRAADERGTPIFEARAGLTWAISLTHREKATVHD